MEERKDECSGTTHEQLFELPSGHRYIVFGAKDKSQIHKILTTPHHAESSDHEAASDSEKFEDFSPDGRISSESFLQPIS